MKPSWRLTTAQKCDVVRRYRAGEKLEAIAADFSITTQAIGTFVNRLGIPLRRPDISIGLKRAAAATATAIGSP